MTTYHKKIVSLNPSVYQNISHLKALEGYKDYVQLVLSLKPPYGKKIPKTFEHWLLTEIDINN